MKDIENPLKVLVACEFSGVVRNAFLQEGHDAWSCDLETSLDGSNRHIQGDVLDVIGWDDWDLLMVAHPPCTRLCNSGVRWLKKPPTNPPADSTPEQAAAWPGLSEAEKLEIMWLHLDQGARLFSKLWNADIPRICIENPVMHPHAKERITNYQDFAQSVQPWQFATESGSPDDEKKRTCFWLKNLPPLKPLNILDGSTAGNKIHSASPGPDRWKVRSKFFPGIAQAMANQWGSLLPEQARAA